MDQGPGRYLGGRGRDLGLGGSPASRRPTASPGADGYRPEYRALADEFRRLSDTAITTQEHVDLRLTDLSVQFDSLRGQLEQMQRILKEVE